MDVGRLHGASEALFIPLLGKAEAERYGDILYDPRAREIVKAVDYDFTAHRQSKFLSIYMGIRAAIIDDYANRFLSAHPEGVVLHLGCGLDTRIDRIIGKSFLWIDLDLPPVIEVRRQFFQETEQYRMLAASVTDHGWLEEIDAGERPVLVLAEGLTMYLSDEENKALFRDFQRHFSETEYVFDAYSVSAVKWSKWKNPVNKLGAVIRWGLDDPGAIERAVAGVIHRETRYFTGQEWEERLSGTTRFWFHILYGNTWANSLYRIYCFQIPGEDQA